MLGKIFTNKITQSIVKVAVLPLYASKLLLAHFNANKHLAQISKNIDSYGNRHEVPGKDYPQIGNKIPEHLLDTKGEWLLAKDGTPLSSKFLENELYTGYISPAVPLYMLVGAMLVSLNIVFSAMNLQNFSMALLAVYSFFFVRMLGFGTFFWFALTAFPFAIISQLSSFPMVGQLLGETKGLMSKAPFIVSLLPALFIYFNTRTYLKNYYASMANESLTHVTSYKAQIDEGRLTQAVNAISDTSAVMIFGESLGVTASKGDPYGPDKGKAFALTHLDLRTNTLVEGKTQTGKTTGFLIPVANHIAHNQIEDEAPDSFIVACGKRTLPKAFAENGLLEDKYRIHPDFMKVNWIHEMAQRPEFVSYEIKKAIEGSKGQNTHWTLSAQIAFECSLTIHSALIDMAHGNTSQNSYFQTIRDVQLSMSEADNAKDDEELKKLVAGKTPEEAKEIAAQFASQKKATLINKLMGHDDLVNPESMLSRAITNYDMIFAKTPEERSGVFSTLAAWIDMFTANPKLNAWSFVTADQNEMHLREWVRSGVRASIELSQDEFGLAGPIITKLFFRFFASYILEERPLDRHPSYPYFHIFLDEAHMIADENLAENMSLLLSKRVSYKVAFQMDESILAKFDESFLKTLKDNCHIQVTFDSSEKTLESFSNGAGFIHRKKRKVNQHTRDIVQTVSKKAGSEWLNLNSENRAYLNKMFRHVHKKYVRGFIPSVHNFKMNKQGAVVRELLSNYQHAVTVVDSEQQEPIFSKSDFTNQFAKPFTCAVKAKVAGVVRRDFVRIQPMNNKGQRVNVSAQAKIQEIVEREKETA